MGECSARSEIGIDDLNAALDEINTLMEVQDALQDASQGFLFLPCYQGPGFPRRKPPPLTASETATAKKTAKMPDLTKRKRTMIAEQPGVHVVHAVSVHFGTAGILAAYSAFPYRSRTGAETRGAISMVTARRVLYGLTDNSAHLLICHTVSTKKLPGENKGDAVH